MINKDDIYLQDPERLKLLAPVMRELGVECDKTIRITDPNFIYKPIPTWHTATMELVLPEWLYAQAWGSLYERKTIEWLSSKQREELFDLRLSLYTLRGQPKAIALCDLIVLLAKEELL